jgi:hypothetical protein
MNELNLQRLCECQTEHEARIVESELAEIGIQAVITGTDVSALGEALDGPDAIQVFVKAEQLDAASELLEQLDADDEDPVPAWTCQCGEDVDEGFFVCWSCQATFDDQAAEH